MIGTIYVLDGLDFETSPSHTLSVTVFDSTGLNDTGVLTVLVTNEQEPPVITNLPDVISISESASSSKLIFNVTSWDPEDDQVYYNMTQTPNNGQFYITASS